VTTNLERFRENGSVLLFGREMVAGSARQWFDSRTRYGVVVRDDPVKLVSVAPRLVFCAGFKVEKR
jgi:hypothetical protein